MGNILRYLLRWDRRRRLPSHFVTRFEVTDVTEDELLIFEAGRAKDRHYVRRLMRRYRAKDAIDLLSKLPRRRRPSVRGRMLALIQRALGVMPYDPAQREYHKIMEARRPSGGLRTVRMKPGKGPEWWG